jgi:predicted small lipoprotein YifL
MRNAIRYRRFLALICAMILVALTVAGCGQKTEPEQAGAEKVAEAAPAEEISFDSLEALFKNEQ